MFMIIKGIFIIIIAIAGAGLANIVFRLTGFCSVSESSLLIYALIFAFAAIGLTGFKNTILKH